MNFLVFLSEQWILVSILAVLIYMFAMHERVKGGKPISAHEVTRLLNSGEAVLVDVRDAKEYQAGHIVDALNIPHNKMGDRMSELDKFKDKIVVVTDKMGQHAGAVGKKLNQAGFQARRLSGGMSEWSGQGLPVVRS